MNSKSALKTIVRRIKVKRPSETLTIDGAATEIADALNIRNEAAMMTLYGLCATGNVRWLKSYGRKLVTA
jgi:hypothetical protein